MPQSAGIYVKEILLHWKKVCRRGMSLGNKRDEGKLELFDNIRYILHRYLHMSHACLTQSVQIWSFRGAP